MRALQIWDENIYKKIVLKMYYKEIFRENIVIFFIYLFSRIEYALCVSSSLWEEI